MSEQLSLPTIEAPNSRIAEKPADLAIWDNWDGSTEKLLSVLNEQSTGYTSVISLRIDADIYRALKKISERAGMPVSAYLRDMIKNRVLAKTLQGEV